MKVYVVLEEDRGCGVSVVGVYTNKELALKVVSESSRYEWHEEELVAPSGKRIYEWCEESEN